jgi:hypothetical protein
MAVYTAHPKHLSRAAACPSPAPPPPLLGYLDKDKCTGWDVAAMGDMNWDFGGT